MSARKATVIASSSERGAEQVGDRILGQGEPGDEATHHQRRDAAGQQQERRAAELLGVVEAQQVHRAQQVHGDVALVHPLGHLPGAEGLDRGEQRLAQPHIGRRLQQRVPAELAARRADRGEHDRGADEPEHRVGEDARGGRHPVGGVLAEGGSGDPSVSRHSVNPSALWDVPQDRGGCCAGLHLGCVGASVARAVLPAGERLRAPAVYAVPVPVPLSEPDPHELEPRQRRRPRRGGPRGGARCR